MDRKNKPRAVGVRLQNAGSVQQGHKGCGAKGALYVRTDLLNRFRNSPLLARVVMTEAEFERLCKTRIGRVYVSSFEWETCSPQSLFG